MEILICIFQGAIVVGLLVVIFLQVRSPKPPPSVDPDQLSSDLSALQTNLSSIVSTSSMGLSKQTTESIQELRQELQKEVSTEFRELKDNVQTTLSQGRTEQSAALAKATGALESRFSSLQKSIADNLTTLNTATGQVVSVSKDVQSLHNILKSPHGRGAFGEMSLEFLLGNMLGNTGMYQRQYTLDGNEKVDAAVFVNCEHTRVIGIDSKFPLANATPVLGGNPDPLSRAAYRKAFDNDVLRRAEEVRSKYIKPPKTEDFAFMFVPSESVFCLMLENAILYEKILSMKVYPVSPTTLLASLQIVLRNIQKEHISRNAEEIRKSLDLIAQDFGRFQKDFEILGGHIENSLTKYHNSEKDVSRLSLRFEELKRGSPNGI
jgi:DNA recombination protein RmuC